MKCNAYSFVQTYYCSVNMNSVPYANKWSGRQVWAGVHMISVNNKGIYTYICFFL